MAPFDFSVSGGWFRGAEDKFVVEEIIQNHGYTGSENKDAGAFDKIKIERKMYCGGDVEYKFIKWSDEFEEPSKEGAD